MDDPCNTSDADQQLYLIPNPLQAPCRSNYSLPIESLQSSYDEMDTVIDYIRALRANDQLRINLIGLSRGGVRVIGYAVLHPDKVDKLVLNSPGVIPPNPASNVAMRVFNKAAAFSFWQLDPANCPNQVDPAIRDKIWDTMLALDELGSSWGVAGVNRAPGLSPSGWAPTFPKMVQAPSLLIRGALDNIVTAEQVQTLYNDLGSTQKVLVTVSCASHAFVWENQHMILLRASAEWIGKGTFAEQRSGSFFVDAEGRVNRE